MVSSRDSFFGSDFEFSTSNGLMVAFGLTAYDSNQEPIEDQSYGQLKAYYKTWGMPGDPPGVNWQEMPTKPCSRGQLGLSDSDDGDSSLFFPVHRNSEYDIGYYNKKFKCVEEKNLRIQGDYNSGVTRSFIVQFEKCEQEKAVGFQCKSEEEIIKWLRRKFILTYSN